jgi:hypothetical protein
MHPNQSLCRDGSRYARRVADSAQFRWHDRTRGIPEAYRGNYRGKRTFKILEIVPDVKAAAFGYYVNGQEPNIKGLLRHIFKRN